MRWSLPPPCEVEFQIDLTLESTLKVKLPYRLALLGVKEIMSQLQELLEVGFVRSSSLSWRVHVGPNYEEEI